MRVLHIPSNICQVPLKFIIKRTLCRTSLMVQFLRLHLPKQGTWVQSLVGELRSSIAVGNANWYSHFGKKSIRQFLICMHAKSLQSCLTLCNPTRLLCSWDSPGRNTGVGCHALLQTIFLGLSCLLHCQVCSLPLVPPGKPSFLYK